MSNPEDETKTENPRGGKDGDIKLVAQSASSNIALQLFISCLSFFLNAFSLRYVTNDMLGVGNVRLLLIKLTVLFIVREPCRRACIGYRGNPRHLINLTWCAVPVAVSISTVMGYLWCYVLEQPDPATVPHYRPAVAIMCLSPVLSVCTLPMEIPLRANLYLGVIVVVQAALHITSSVTTVLLLVFAPHLGAIIWSVVHIVASVTAILGYLSFSLYQIHVSQDPNFPVQSALDFLPGRGPTWTDPDLLRLTRTFAKQSVLKQFLGQGERYIMSVFGVLSFADQGVYDVVTNLASVVPRVVFQNLEDSSYIYFAHVLTRDKPSSEQPSASVASSARVLATTLRFATIIGLGAVVFGFSYSPVLLRLYGGDLLIEGGGVYLMRVYTLYVLIIAVNGTTEAFTFGSMSQQKVDRYNLNMLGFSTTFLFSSLVLTRFFGSVGFIFANCINMLLRIIYSCFYIRSYFTPWKTRPVLESIPSRPVWFAFLGCFIATRITTTWFAYQSGLLYDLLNLLVGGAIGLVLLAVIWLTETNLMRFLSDHYLPVLLRKKEKLKTQ